MPAHRAVLILLALSAAPLLALTSSARADLWNWGGRSASDNAPACEALATVPVPAPWPPQQVWLGHFSGGNVVRIGGGLDINWQDGKTCFSSRRDCERWIGVSRRAAHNPPGYWTCLPIRP